MGSDVDRKTWCRKVSLSLVTEVNRSRDSSVGIVSRPQAGLPRNVVRFLVGSRNLSPFSNMTISALEPTESVIR